MSILFMMLVSCGKWTPICYPHGYQTTNEYAYPVDRDRSQTFEKG